MVMQRLKSLHIQSHVCSTSCTNNPRIIICLHNMLCNKLHIQCIQSCCTTSCTNSTHIHVCITCCVTNCTNSTHNHMFAHVVQQVAQTTPRTIICLYNMLHNKLHKHCTQSYICTTYPHTIICLHNMPNLLHKQLQLRFMIICTYMCNKLYKQYTQSCLHNMLCNKLHKQVHRQSYVCTTSCVTSCINNPPQSHVCSTCPHTITCLYNMCNLLHKQLQARLIIICTQIQVVQTYTIMFAQHICVANCTNNSTCNSMFAKHVAQQVARTIRTIICLYNMCNKLHKRLHTQSYVCTICATSCTNDSTQNHMFAQHVV